MVAMAETASTAKVTVLIPPAVPTGEPPITISSRHTMEDALVRSCWGTVAKPVVLVVTDWNSAAWIFAGSERGPTVSGLSYSNRKISSPPPNIRISVAVMAILL